MDFARIVEQSNASSTPDVNPIVIRCYTTVGEISGFGKISFDAQQVVSSDEAFSKCSVRFTVTTGEEYPTSGIAIVDYEDVDRLCATLDRLRALDPSVSKFKFIEATCEFGDLKVTVFNMQNGKVFFATTAHNASVHMEIGKLSQFIDLVGRTKSTIEQIRVGS